MKLQKEMIWRWLFYGIGLIVLAIGIILNTQTGLGVSPIISVPYSISKIWELNFATMTFIVYSIQVGIQFIIKGKNREWKDVLRRDATAGGTADGACQRGGVWGIERSPAEAVELQRNLIVRTCRKTCRIRIFGLEYA